MMLVSLKSCYQQIHDKTSAPSTQSWQCHSWWNWRDRNSSWFSSRNSSRSLTVGYTPKNKQQTPIKIVNAPKGNSSSNHPFSGAMLVLGRVASVGMWTQGHLKVNLKLEPISTPEVMGRGIWYYPYAPIPSVSGFGGFFGCLNTEPHRVFGALGLDILLTAGF